MYEIKVTVEVPGLPEALNALASAMSKGQSAAFLMQHGADSFQQVDSTGAVNVNKPAEAIHNAKENPTTPAAAPTTPANAEAASAVQTSPAPGSSPSKSYSLDDLSRAGATLIDQGKMPQLLELLKKYGVQAVTQLDPGTYPAFVEEMKALGAQL